MGFLDDIEETVNGAAQRMRPRSFLDDVEEAHARVQAATSDLPRETPQLGPTQSDYALAQAQARYKATRERNIYERDKDIRTRVSDIPAENYGGLSENEALARSVARHRAEDVAKVRETEQLAGPEDAVNVINGQNVPYVYDPEQLHPRSPIRQGMARIQEALGQLNEPPPEYWRARERLEANDYGQPDQQGAAGAALSAGVGGVNKGFEYLMAPLTEAAAVEREHDPNSPLATAIENAPLALGPEAAAFMGAQHGVGALKEAARETSLYGDGALDPATKDALFDAAGLYLGGKAAGFAHGGLPTAPEAGGMRRVVREEPQGPFVRPEGPDLGPFIVEDPVSAREGVADARRILDTRFEPATRDAELAAAVRAQSERLAAESAREEARLTTPDPEAAARAQALAESVARQTEALRAEEAASRERHPDPAAEARAQALRSSVLEQQRLLQAEEAASRERHPDPVAEARAAELAQAVAQPAVPAEGPRRASFEQRQALKAAGHSDDFINVLTPEEADYYLGRQTPPPEPPPAAPPPVPQGAPLDPTNPMDQAVALAQRQGNVALEDALAAKKTELGQPAPAASPALRAQQEQAFPAPPAPPAPAKPAPAIPPEAPAPPPAPVPAPPAPLSDVGPGRMPEPRLGVPEWVAEDMARRGYDLPSMVFRLADVDQPHVRAQILKDPTLTDRQKANLIGTGSIKDPPPGTEAATRAEAAKALIPPSSAAPAPAPRLRLTSEQLRLLRDEGGYTVQDIGQMTQAEVSTALAGIEARMASEVAALHAGVRGGARGASGERGAALYGGPIGQALVGGAEAIGRAFRSREPYQSALPPEMQAPQRAIEAARPPNAGIGRALKEMAGRTARGIESFADVYSELKNEPGVGLATKNGKPLDLQTDMKALSHKLMEAEEIGRERAAAFQAEARSPEDLALAGRVVILRDLARMAREGKEGLSGHTPATIAANLAEAEAALAKSPGAQAAVAKAREAFAETAADRQARNPKAANLEDYFHHEVFFEGARGGGKSNLASPLKRETPGSSRQREGTERLFNPDVAEVIYKTVRDEKRARILHEFAQRLEKSPNNYVAHIRDTGTLPPGMKPSDVVLWSFERQANTLSGPKAEAVVQSLIENGPTEAALRTALEAGDARAASDIVRHFGKGGNQPYMILKRPVAEVLDGLHAPSPKYGLAMAAVDATTTLFRATALAARGGLGYLLRNFANDIVNTVILGSKTAEIPRNVAGAATKTLKLGALRAGEVYRDIVGRPAEDPVLAEAREQRAMHTGLFGSGGALRNRGILSRLSTGKEGPRPPMRALPPGQKVARFAESAIKAPFHALAEVQTLIEAAPRKQAVEALIREGYNKEAAVVLGNQIAVDYSLLSKKAGLARRIFAPFIAYTLQTNLNFLKFPVRGPASVLTRMAGIYGAANLFNWFATPDDERSLSPDQQARPHLNIGRDKKGRVVSVDLTKVGFEPPTAYKAIVAATAKAASAAMGEEGTDRTVGRIAGGYGRAARADVLGLPGPIGSGAVALAFDRDLRTLEPLGSDALEKAAPEVRARRNADRFGVPESIGESTRWSKALSPFTGPYASYRQATNERDPMKAGEKFASLAGDPRIYSEPGDRASSLRHSEGRDALEAFARAIEAKDTEGRKRALALLKELRVAPAVVNRFLDERAASRAKERIPAETRRRQFNARNAP